jgi:PKD domain-containing protein
MQKARFGGGHRAWLAGLVVFLVVLAIPGTSRAVPTWVPPQSLSAAGGASPQVAFDDAGDAFAIWERSGAVEAAIRPAGRDWTAARVISATCPGPTQDARLAVNAAGAAVATWQCNPPTGAVIQAAVRPSARGWEPAENLPAQGFDNSAAGVALDAAGDAVAVWLSNDGTINRIQASYRPANGAWQPSEFISNGVSSFPEVAMGGGGDAVAVWMSGDGTIEAASRPSGGAWASQQALSVANSWYPYVGVDAAGDAVAVWEDPGFVAQAAIRPAGGSWGQPENLSNPNDLAFGPKVVVAPGGAAVVVWNNAGGGYAITATSRPAGGTWSAPQAVSAYGPHFWSYALAIDRAGDALVAWSRQIGEVDAVEAARRAAGGAWSAPERFTPTTVNGETPDVALDAAGDGAAVWQSTNLDGAFVQASGLDAAGPVVRRLSIGGHRRARARVTFSVSAFDVWSDLGGPPRWTFGDGIVRYGLRVAHTYRRPGSYKVRLQLVDGFGNKTLVTRRLKIGRARRG